ncbi:putative Ig domain-containing protein [Piscinibacter terrae]|nr:putative Ig domain-containing protein [Albitalea terrae]
MDNNQSATLLEYANLQIAAESMFGVKHKALVPGEVVNGSAISENDAKDMLLQGNDHTSRFTESQFDQFWGNWRLVEHKANTDTGFSGSLYKYVGEPDPNLNLTPGQLVLSIRSTEFIEDSVRDNQATNTLELSSKGWAFGQIADMQKWYGELKERYPTEFSASQNKVDVTGYSLGGSLATSFNLLYPSEIRRTYTFNGAGVGVILTGTGVTDSFSAFDTTVAATGPALTALMANFKEWKDNGSASLFTDSEVAAKYAALRLKYGPGSVVTKDMATQDATEIKNMRPGVPGPVPGTFIYFPTTRNNELGVLQEALENIASIAAVSETVNLLAAGDSKPGETPAHPADIRGVNNIAGLRLDYQVAMLRVSKQTKAVDKVTGAITAVIGRIHAQQLIENFFDVYGAPKPSAVSNSQVHYGHETGIYIEDQPLSRGTYVGSVEVESWAAKDVRLLVDHYNDNDFGDTHSLPLIVDSLNIQKALTKLDPTINQDTLDLILSEASSAKQQVTLVSTEDDPKSQGRAEGDTLENVLNALNRMVVGPSAAVTPANMRGGTWADPAARGVFHKNLQDLLANPTFLALKGNVLVTASAKTLDASRTDFASFLALLELSPFVIRAKEGVDPNFVETKLKAGWATVWANWSADRALVASGKAAETYTDQYLADRQAMLRWINIRNAANTNDGRANIDFGQPFSTTYSNNADASATEKLKEFNVDNTLLLFGDRRKISFGSSDVDTLTGASLGDHLYGGGGNDVIDGKDGNDYLEGNAGNDVILGGKGRDTLLGGAGNDVLDGGVGDDTLSGGAGDDSYSIGEKSGLDTILTSDAGDSLQIGTRTLTGGGELQFGAVSGQYLWLDKSVPADLVSYQFNASTGELTVTASGSTVVIKDFQDGDLGLHIPVPAPAPAPPPGGTPTIDVAGLKGTVAGSGDITTPEYFINANQLGSSSGAPGFPARVVGELFARGGNDTIQGGLSNPSNPIIISAGSGNDHVFAGSLRSLDVALADTTPANGQSNLMVDGGSGNDEIQGSAGDDAIFGGDGNDTLVGGAGRDVIFSDGDSGRTIKRDEDIRFVAGTNDPVYYNTLYFNAPVKLGTIYTGTQSSESSNYYFQYLIDALGSTDFTGLASLRNVLVDGDPRFAAFPGGRFYGEGTPDMSEEPDLAVMFNSNRHSGSDVIYAGSGDDMVNAGGGDDYVDAGDGNDAVAGYQGDDQIEGGSGNDRLWGDYSSQAVLPADQDLGVTTRTWQLDPSQAGQEHGNDYIDGGTGDDWIAGDGGDDVLFGGDGKDSIYGDDPSSPDGKFIVDAFGGNDYIEAGAGDDLVQGGAKDDDISGDDGNDALFGDNHFADIKPAAANVTAAGNDTIDGGAGNDSIWGEGGADELYGGTGDDQIMGDALVDQVAAALHGADYIDGEEGNDILLGCGGNDTIFGGAGNDWLAGEDQASSDDVTTLTGDDYLSGDAGNDSLLGGVGADTLLGGDGSDYLNGGTGNDILDGGAGNDSLLGGDGNDTLTGGAGIDVMQGGKGDDTYVLTIADITTDGVNGESISDDEGKNTIKLVDASSSQVTAQSTGSGSDVALVVDATHVVIVKGGIEGSTESVEFTDKTVTMDRLIGETYDQSVNRTVTVTNGRLYGGKVNDELSVGRDVSGATLSGGKGTDILTSNAISGVTVLYSKGDGTDRFRTDWELGTSRSGSNVLQLGAEVSLSDLRVARTSGGQYVLNVGTDAADGINFAASDEQIAEESRPFDQLVFADGTNAGWQQLIDQGVLIDAATTSYLGVIGTWSNDIIRGNAAAHILDGGYGDDRFEAGTGNETMVGGEGNDTYVLKAGTGQDVIDNHSAVAGETDRILLGAGLDFSKARLTKWASDLHIDFTGSTDTVTVQGFFVNSGNETVEFEGGPIFDRNSTGFGSIQALATEGNDNLVLTADGDTFDALGGNDSISGDAGNDLLRGGDGNDTLGGDADNDTLFGGAGSDTVRGSWGADVLYGDDGSDLLDGGSDDDQLFGGTGNDWLDAGSGNDTLQGDAGDDTLLGGNGNDLLIASAGSDELRGGAGSDTYLFNPGAGTTVITDDYGTNFGIDTLRFGSGIAPGDIVATRVDNNMVIGFRNQPGQVILSNYFSGFAAAKIGSVVFDGGATWTASELEAHMLTLTELADSVVGSFGDDSLNALGGNDTVDGGAGNDYIDGGTGDDLVMGGAGNDTLRSIGGNDTMVGGTGDDSLAMRDSSVAEFSLGDGRDTVDAPSTATLKFGAGINFSSFSISALSTSDNRGGIRVSYSPTDSVVIQGAPVNSWWTSVRSSRYDADYNEAAMLLPVWTSLPTLQLANGERHAVSELLGPSGIPPVVGTDGDDVLAGTASRNSGASGGVSANRDMFFGGKGNDTIYGGDGWDIYYFNVGDGHDVTFNSVHNLVDSNGMGGASVGPDRVVFGSGITPDSVYRLVTLAAPNSLTYVYDAGGDSFSASGAPNHFVFSDGTDHAAGDNWYSAIPVVGERRLASDGSMDVAGGTYALEAGITNANIYGTGSLLGNALNNRLSGQSSQYGVTLDGGMGADTMMGGVGGDTFVVDNAGDVIIDSSGYTDTVVSTISYSLQSGLENLVLSGSAAISGTGNSVGNVIDGSQNTASNQLAGGLGDDTYLVDASDVVVELAGEGTDTVQAAVSVTLSSNVENLVLLGTANINGQGSSDANILTGNSGANQLDGAAGDDGLLGGGGDDKLNGGDGADFLSGEDGNDTLWGGAGNDVLAGGFGNNTYRFGRGDGADMVRANYDATSGKTNTLEFLSGVAPTDIVRTKVNGTDLQVSIAGTSDSITIEGVYTDSSPSNPANPVQQFKFADGTVWDLATYSNLSNNHAPTVFTPIPDKATAEDALFSYAFPSTTFKDVDTGDTLAYTAKLSNGAVLPAWLTFNASTRTFSGTPTNSNVGTISVRVTAKDSGNLTVTDDFNITVTNTNDAPTLVTAVPTQSATQGQSFSYVVPATTFNDVDVGDTLTYSLKRSDGTALPAWLAFNSATRALTGTPANADVGGLSLKVTATDVAGASASSTFTMNVANVNDAPVLANAIPDQAANAGAAFSYTVAATAFTDPDTGDTLTYSATLADGTALPAWLAFNPSTRTFSGTPSTTGTISVKVIAKDSGNLSASDTFDIAVTIQNQTLTGTTGVDNLVGGAGNDTLSGLAGNDTLTGNAGNDRLDGGAGNDTMKGGTGDDVYVVDSTSDVVTENASEGIDTVESTVTLTLAANVENLTLTGTGAISGTGNTLDNVLTGNSGANTLKGLAGNDTYVVSTGDTVTENASEGTDTVKADITWTLGANLENLILTGSSAINGTGNTANNMLTGNAGNNTLDGSTGADTMAGGAGNDVYVVDNTADLVTENANEGTDLVQSSVTWTLGNNVENLTLTGSGAINGTGNALDNVLTGNSGANVLKGLAGNDTYVVGTGDTVTENANEGIDTVQSSIAWTLGANTENLTLTGSTAINGTGNTLDNVLVGNSAANVLKGLAGNDTYVVGTGDTVTENANEGIDTVQSSITWTLGTNLENLTLTGTSAINGTGNAVDNVLVGNSAANTLTGAAGNDTLDGGAGNDSLIGGTGNDTYVVDVTGDVLTENANEGTDLVKSAVTWTLGTNFEDLTLTGTGAINGTGTASNNVLTGNAAANTLTGNAGNDTLDGGSGVDSLVGGTGADIYRFGVGYGVDTIVENDSTAGVKDAVQFLGTIKQADVTFSHVSNNLEVLLNGTGDKLIVKDFYLASANHVEEFRFTDGTVVLDSAVQGLAAAMAQFNAGTATALVSPDLTRRAHDRPETHLVASAWK